MNASCFGQRDMNSLSERFEIAIKGANDDSAVLRTTRMKPHKMAAVER
jgi:hypothetical protein